jgi:hypothetical protein
MVGFKMGLGPIDLPLKRKGKDELELRFLIRYFYSYSCSKCHVALYVILATRTIFWGRLSCGVCAA